MAKRDLLKRLGVEHPVIQAPMGGGPSTPALVAAVSNAGGLGSLGAPYLTPQQILDAVAEVRRLTSKAFNVNLFAGGQRSESGVDPKPMLEILAAIHAELGLPPPSLPVLPPDPFEAQLEAVLEARPPIFSFTFGIPSLEQIARLKGRGIAVLGTATTVAEARLLEEAGVDGIVAQGAEAAAHRGTFAGAFETSMVPTLELVRGISSAVALPVAASGGLMDGRDIAAALCAGAAAAALGTAFLACPESGASASYKDAILSARADTTVITRAFSGRPARGLANRFIATLAGKEAAILPYPLQNALTRAMRAEAAKRGTSGFLSLWAGTGVARARALPAGELVRQILREMSAEAVS
ncbi:MAG TPA: nitronate monooxygenase [Stellaceae bacterium]|nr:nitronate monooxygenase [Stellaceae bacterium]